LQRNPDILTQVQAADNCYSEVRPRSDRGRQEQYRGSRA
jgi:hypothetical protein